MFHLGNKLKTEISNLNKTLEVLRKDLKELREENEKLSSINKSLTKFSGRESFELSDIKHETLFYFNGDERLIVKSKNKWASMTVVRNDQKEIHDLTLTKSGWVSKTELLKYMKDASYIIATFEE